MSTLVLGSVRRLPPSTRAVRGAAATLGPVAFVLVNALAFYVVRPGVPDLWAARARASASGHGVGLTYWFSWFGGSTPGNYSVVTPYLCGVFGTELVAALAAVAAAGLASVLTRGTRRPLAGAYVAGIGIVVNLWCGRVPFLVGAAIALAALVCLRARRTVPAGVLAVLSVLASPVSGAFLALGLSGMVLSRRAGDRRTANLVVVGCAGATLVLLGLLFGAPGPEPFPLYLLGEIALLLGLLMFAAPPGHLRTTLVVSAVVAVVVFSVPNGMGANLVRWALFCLPAAAAALSTRSPRTLALLVTPVVVLAALSSVSALRSAAGPASTVAYYTPLTGELDALPTHAEHRLELVGASHAAYAVLLDHAVLARGWETQEDHALNGVLDSPTLDARGYRRWLDDNAVGLVAVDVRGGPTPESRVIKAVRGGGYLHLIWSSAHWRLYQVQHSTPIVSAPAVLESSSQSTMTVRVPCACRTSVRIRFSDFLDVTPRLAPTTPDWVQDSYRPVLAQTRSGWTTLTTNRAGTYDLDG